MSEEMGRQRRLLQRDGRLIPYTVTGNGPPLMVIGFGFYTLRLLSDRIRHSFTIVATDYYGLDADTPNYTPEEMSLEGFLVDLRTLQLHLGIEKTSILGHSSSGTVALDYALRYPELVAHAVLACAPDRYDTRFIRLQQEHQARNLRGARKRAYQERIADFRRRQSTGEIATDSLFVEFHNAQRPLYWFRYNAVPERDYWQGIRVNQSFINEFVGRTYAVYRRSTPIDQLETPTTVILGKHDFATPSTAWDAYSAVASIDIHVMKKSGHFPMIEEQARFDRIVLDRTAV